MRNIFFLACILSGLFAISLASAADIYVCSTCEYTADNFTLALDLSNNTDNTIIFNESGSYIMNFDQHYYINDTAGNGVIVLSADDIFLDCNNSFFQTLYPSDSIAATGIIVEPFNNITVKQCKFTDYYDSYYLNHSTNVTVNDSESLYATHAGFYFTGSSDNRLNSIRSSYENKGLHMDSTRNTAIAYYNLTGSTDGNAIYMNLSDNNSLYGARITGSFGASGFYLDDSDNNSIAASSINEVGGGELDYGIYVHGSVGTQINDTNLTDSLYYGIMLDSSNSSSLNNNIINNVTFFYGIYVSGINNFLSGQKVYDAFTSGIYLDHANSTTILGSTVANGQKCIFLNRSFGVVVNDTNLTGECDGIWLNYSDSNSINNNIMDQMEYYGVCLISSHNNNITNNKIYSAAGLDNINLENSNYTNILSNFLNGSDFSGVNLVNSSYSNISNNNISKGDSGIEMENAVGNVITRNIIENTSWFGILLENTRDSDVLNNGMANTSIGVYLDNTSDCRIENITFHGWNSNAVYLSMSDRNNLTNLKALDSGYNGTTFDIELYYSNFNRIVGCEINNSFGPGIMLESSNNNSFLSNNVSYISEGGIVLWWSSNNYFEDNYVHEIGDSYGITLDYSGFNHFANNTINNVADGGYQFAFDSAAECAQNFTGNNTVDGRPVIFMLYASDYVLSSPESFDIISFAYSRNVTVRDVTSGADLGGGIMFCNVTSSLITNVTLTDILQGILLQEGGNNTISNNTINLTSGSNSVGIEILYSDSNLISDNILNANGAFRGIAVYGSDSITIWQNTIRDFMSAITLYESPDPMDNLNITHNDFYSYSSYGIENQQRNTLTAIDNFWGDNYTWEGQIDQYVYDDDEDNYYGAVDFCPYLNASFSEGGVSTECIYPSLGLFVNDTNVSKESFQLIAIASDIMFSNGSYWIYNSSNASKIWANGTLNATTKNISATFDSIFLPVGMWNITANYTDTNGKHHTNQTQINSTAALRSTLKSDSSQTVTIDGTNLTINFNLTAKGYRDVRFYMSLDATDDIYNNSHAEIGNTSTKKTIANSSSYSGAQSFPLPDLTSAPAYALITSGIYQGSSTKLYMEAYSSLSEDTYEGDYGWALFNSSKVADGEGGTLSITFEPESDGGDDDGGSPGGGGGSIPPRTNTTTISQPAQATIANVDQLLASVSPSELGYSTLETSKMKAERVTNFSVSTTADVNSLAMLAASVPGSDSQGYVAAVADGLKAGDNGVLAIKRTVETFKVKTIYSNVNSQANRTRVTLVVSSPATALNVTVLEMIPKSAAQNDSMLMFPAGSNAVVMEKDPLISWNIPIINAGETKTLVYYIKSMVKTNVLQGAAVYQIKAAQNANASADEANEDAFLNEDLTSGQEDLSAEQPGEGEGATEAAQENAPDTSQGQGKVSFWLVSAIFIIFIVIAGAIAGFIIKQRNQKEESERNERIFEANASQAESKETRPAKGLTVRPGLTISSEKLLELEESIDKQLAAGKPDADVRIDLIKGGWDVKAIDMVMHDVHIVDNNVEKLNKYIQSCMARGMAIKDVKKALVRAGWREDMVELAFTHLKQ